MSAAAEPVQPPVRPLATRARLEQWWRSSGGGARHLLDRALVPAELVYRAAAGCYHHAYDAGWLSAARARVPVVSVGNLVVGGAGKTPVSAWLVDELRRQGASPVVLHGGYASDEPALHRQWHPTVPVIAERDRTAAAHRAVAAGATVLVLDDGFQHRRLARDVDLVLVPAESWTSRPHLLPRGSWRERPRALARAQVVAVVRKTASIETARRVAGEVAALAPECDIVHIHLRPSGWRRAGTRTTDRTAPADTTQTRPAPDGSTAGVARTEQRKAFIEGARQRESARRGSTPGISASGRPDVFADNAPRGVGPRGSTTAASGGGRSDAVVDNAPQEVKPSGSSLAVAGIAQPEAFVDNARQAGARVDAVLFFPDHHCYGPRDLACIRHAAAGRPVVTTAKDALKLEAFNAELELWVLEQQVVLEGGTSALARILDRLVL